MTTIRAFIAIDLPKEIRTNLEATVQKFKARSVHGVRWVPVDNIHLTLKFLGDISSGNLERLTKLLQVECAALPSFPVEVAGVGAFPNHRRPRIIWVGVQAPPELKTLQACIESAASQMGIQPEERDFSPHLTLGRVRNEISFLELQALSATLDSIQVGALGRFTVNQFTLFRSDLRPQGPLYTVMAQFNLNTAES